MFSFRFTYFKLATYKERLILEAAIRSCDAFIQELRYRYPHSQMVYGLSTNDHEKFTKKFQECYAELWADCEMSDVKGT